MYGWCNNRRCFMGMQLNDSILLANGYERCKRTALDSKNILCNFKKCFFDDGGNGKYLIIVHKWDNGFIPISNCEEERYPYGYEYSVQMETKYNKLAEMNFRADWELWEVEDFVELLFDMVKS